MYSISLVEKIDVKIIMLIKEYSTVAFLVQNRGRRAEIERGDRQGAIPK